MPCLTPPHLGGGVNDLLWRNNIWTKSLSDLLSDGGPISTLPAGTAAAERLLVAAAAAGGAGHQAAAAAGRGAAGCSAPSAPRADPIQEWELNGHEEG